MCLDSEKCDAWVKLFVVDIKILSSVSLFFFKVLREQLREEEWLTSMGDDEISHQNVDEDMDDEVCFSFEVFLFLPLRRSESII